LEDRYELYQGDCLEVMQDLEDKSIDMVLCDLPYGTTQNKWDTIIPLDKLWKQYKRICRGAVVLTAAQPFSSTLVCSNLAEFRYQWIWVKTKITGVLNAKRMPVRKHEQVLVFSAAPTVYNAQGLVRKGTVTKQGGNSGNYGDRDSEAYIQEWTNWPRDVLEIASEGKTVHPTQKPVALMEYLIRTYTNEGMTVLDNCMGSGTTGVACMNTGRNFIGIEKDDKYIQIAYKRITEAAEKAQLNLQATAGE
jgi:site-specific DNA-methyltransferase (adenine-specific)